ncbi:MAG: LptE family protein [Fibrobacterota bacterium]
MLRFLTFFTVFSLFFNASCVRYSFSGSTLPSHIRTVSIPIPENASSQTGLEESLRDIIDRAFASNNQLRVMPSGGDAELQMNILSYGNNPGEYDKSGVVSTYKVSITVAVRFYDTRENKTLYENRLTGTGEYNHDTETETTGRDNALRKIGEMIINNTIAGW